MNFHEHIIALRSKNKIPKVWGVLDIRPFLKDDFELSTINVYPSNCSITPDGKIKGNYVKNGQVAKFYRVGRGKFILIEEYENTDEEIFKKEEKRGPVKRSTIGNSIDDLINDFIPCLNYFNDNIKFSGPSTYFHQKTIDKIRAAPDYNDLLRDNYFLELVYATLVSWGMHTMGKKGPKMADFEDFKASIAAAKEPLVELQQYKLHTLTEDAFNRIKPLLQIVFEKLKTMASGSRLVGNSKVMHHLLPDLVPPIDRSHTLKFFYGHMNIMKDESEVFLECMEKLHKIGRSVPDLSVITLTGFNTSIPKIIDNAIMLYVMQSH